MALKIAKRAEPVKLAKPIQVEPAKPSREPSRAVSKGSASQTQQAQPVAFPPPLPAEITLDSLIESIDQQQPFYGEDLTAAIANLATLVAAEGASMKDIGTGLCRVNDIFLHKPELCTEIMLPQHLGVLARAAYAYTAIAEELGEARANSSGGKRSKATPAAVPEDDTALD